MADARTPATLAPLLCSKEAAAVLGVSPDTLRVWRSSGRHLIPYIKIGISIRYDRADLIAWLESRPTDA